MYNKYTGNQRISFYDFGSSIIICLLPETGTPQSISRYSASLTTHEVVHRKKIKGKGQEKIVQVMFNEKHLLAT